MMVMISMMMVMMMMVIMMMVMIRQVGCMERRSIGGRVLVGRFHLTHIPTLTVPLSS